jgi:hypothetical protein
MYVHTSYSECTIRALIDWLEKLHKFISIKVGQSRNRTSETPRATPGRQFLTHFNIFLM